MPTIRDEQVRLSGWHEDEFDINMEEVNNWIKFITADVPKEDWIEELQDMEDVYGEYIWTVWGKKRAGMVWKSGETEATTKGEYVRDKKWR